jgi:serine/threonine-protein kinase
MPPSAGGWLGPYQILRRLGEGGMGEVYLAEDSRLSRKVAIKFVAADAAHDERARRRFLREARAAARLDHPNICAIHEVAEADDQPYIVMQYVEGETLAVRLTHGPLPLGALLAIAIQTADALAEAHAHGIVHRDIKPQNLMVSTKSVVKVLDFGLARVIETDEGSRTETVMTEPGSVMGTAAYMAPEQVRGESADARSDVFSLGAVLYEMATGRRAFRGETSAATTAAILTSEPEWRQLGDHPPELHRIIRKCLAKRAGERYQTTGDLAIDLRALQRETDSGSGSPAGAKGRAHGSSAVVAAILGVTLVVAAGWWFWIRPTAAPEAIRSIAILPLAIDRASSDAEYLADGIPEHIINTLSQLPDLKVMSRASTFRFKGRQIDPQAVASELRVEAVMTGRVAQPGDALVISVELVDARDGHQLWGQQFNRKLTDVFALQQEIATAITDNLRLRLSGADRQRLAKRYTVNLKAYQAYMLGVANADHRTREALGAAIVSFERAIAADPQYALAYAALADAHANMAVRGYRDLASSFRDASAAAQGALSLDPELAEAHVAMARIHALFAPADFTAADAELQLALEQSPSLASAYQIRGLSLVSRGRLDESLRAFLQARELDPLSSIIARTVSLYYLLKRDGPKALEALRQANELGPTLSTTWDAAVYVQNQLYDELLTEAEKAAPGRPDDPLLVYSAGLAHAARGDRAKTDAHIVMLDRMGGPAATHARYIASLYAALGDSASALTWLERDAAAEVSRAIYPDEPVWEAVRTEPRFAAVVRRLHVLN